MSGLVVRDNHWLWIKPFIRLFIYFLILLYFLIYIGINIYFLMNNTHIDFETVLSNSVKHFAVPLCRMLALLNINWCLRCLVSTTEGVYFAAWYGNVAFANRSWYKVANVSGIAHNRPSTESNLISIKSKPGSSQHKGNSYLTLPNQISVGVSCS